MNVIKKQHSMNQYKTLTINTPLLTAFVQIFPFLSSAFLTP